jgi:hypothetical protein
MTKPEIKEKGPIEYKDIRCELCGKSKFFREVTESYFIDTCENCGETYRFVKRPDGAFVIDRSYEKEKLRKNPDRLPKKLLDTQILIKNLFAKAFNNAENGKCKCKFQESYSGWLMNQHFDIKVKSKYKFMVWKKGEFLDRSIIIKAWTEFMRLLKEQFNRLVLTDGRHVLMVKRF